MLTVKRPVGQTYRGLGRLGWVWYGLLLVVLGCGAPAAPDDGPVRLVQQVAAAWEAGDSTTILNSIEPSAWRREIGAEIRQYTGIIQSLALDDPTYTLLNNDGTLARVRLEARLRYSLRDGRTGTQPLNLIIETVQLDGTWYIRQLDLAQLSGQ